MGDGWRTNRAIYLALDESRAKYIAGISVNNDDHDGGLHNIAKHEVPV